MKTKEELKLEKKLDVPEFRRLVYITAAPSLILAFIFLIPVMAIRQAIIISEIVDEWTLRVYPKYRKSK